MLEIIARVDQDHGVGATQPGQHSGEHRRHQWTGLIGGAVAGQHIESDTVLAQVLTDIRITLHIEVVEDCRVIAGRGLIDAAGERSEPRHRVDGHHIVRAAFPEDTAETCRHRGLADAALSGDDTDHVLLADMPTDAFPKFAVMPLGG